MSENPTVHAAPMSLSQRVDSLTEILVSQVRFRDEFVKNLQEIKQLAQDHAESVIDAAARNIQGNNQADIAERIKAASDDLENRFHSLTTKIHVALSSRSDAIEKRVMAERQKAVTLADVRPQLEELVAGAIESRRVELSRGADTAAQEAIRVALAELDLSFAKFVLRGQWDPRETYQKNDVVFYRGGSSVALRNTQQMPLTDDWQRLVEGGKRGPAGPDGPAGAIGIESEASSFTLASSHSGRIVRLTAASVGVTVNAESLPALGSALLVAETTGATITRGAGVEFVNVNGDVNLTIDSGGTAGIARLESGVYVVTGDVGAA